MNDIHLDDHDNGSHSSSNNHSNSSNEHDQLPSVEEYKTHMEPGSHKIDPKRIMESVMASDSEDEDLENKQPNINDYSQRYSHEDDQQVIHDQLPTVEEIHAQQRPPPPVDEGKFRRRCGYAIMTIVFLLAIIVPPIILTMDSEYEERKEDISDFLIHKMNIVTASQLDDANSPQRKAVEFLAREAFPNQNLSDEKFVERYTLSVFYYATGGEQWRFQMNFLTSKDVCNWNAYFENQNNGDITQEGAICEDEEAAEESASPMVQLLDIPTNNLAGTLPPELQYLAASLEEMHMEFNPALSGDLPFALSKLTKLSNLELQYCSLTGVLPTWLGRDLPLRRLGLSNNLFEGTIPETLFTEATDLLILGLDDNGLKGDIADFANLQKLQFLYLEDNNIGGSITNELIDDWKAMRELDLSRNSLKGSLPTDLFRKMINLEILDLHGNELTGNIPDSIGINRITFLALQENKLSGTIPQNISTLIDLQHLDLSRNELSGTIPTDLGMLSFLRYLFLGSNSYDAQPIPGQLMGLTSLKELSLKQANLNGTIPFAIGNLTELNLLDLDQNDLQGKIPEELGHSLSNLDHLLLNRNALTGTLPPSFSKLRDLELLLLDHNRLTGTADPICNSIDLRYFVTDCQEFETGDGDFEAAAITCDCCNLCCNAQNSTCNMYDWNVNLDPIWEYGYTRYVYTFSQNVIEQRDKNNPV